MNPAAPEQRTLRFIQPAAMRRDSTGCENTAFIEEVTGTFAVPVSTVIHFPLRLRKMNMDTDLLLPGKFSTPLQPFFGHCVDRVRSCSGFDPGIVQAFYLCSKCLGRFTLLLAFLFREEIDEPVGEHGPNTGFVNRPGCIIHTEVHIIECS